MIHPDLESRDGRVLRRHAARGIVQKNEQILLLFTEHYNDFSFPGGGVDPGEDLAMGLHRELEEETGARDIRILEHLGFIEEFRPHWKPEYDLMHMTSHFFSPAIRRPNWRTPVWSITRWPTACARSGSTSTRP